MTPDEERTIEVWRDAADDLGFRFVAPYTLQDAGESLTYLGWLPQFGADYGMLIISEESAPLQRRVIDAAVAHGFGYSCMTPRSERYNREVIIDVLTDWGWTSSEPAPSWYERSPDCHV